MADERVWLLLVRAGKVTRSLSFRKLLALIRAIEQHFQARNRALGAFMLDPAERRPANVLVEYRRSFVRAYTESMRPHIHDLCTKVFNQLIKGKATAVCGAGGSVHLRGRAATMPVVRLQVLQEARTGRLRTNTPGDLFNLLFEHMSIAREQGSDSLQRRLLSIILSEIVRGGPPGQVRAWRHVAPTPAAACVQTFFASSLVFDAYKECRNVTGCVDHEFIIAGAGACACGRARAGAHHMRAKACSYKRRGAHDGLH